MSMELKVHHRESAHVRLLQLFPRGPGLVDPSSIPAVALKKGKTARLFTWAETANCHDGSWPSRSHIGVSNSRVTKLLFFQFPKNIRRWPACHGLEQDLNRFLSIWRGNGEMGKWGKPGDELYSGVTAVADLVVDKAGRRDRVASQSGGSTEGNVKAARP